MKKWWIALALIFVLLNGCGKTDEADIAYLDGFEKAEYENIIHMQLKMDWLEP